MFLHKKVIYAYLLWVNKFYNLQIYFCKEFKTDL